MLQNWVHDQNNHIIHCISNLPTNKNKNKKLNHKGQTKVHILIQAQRQLPFDFLIPKQNFEIKLQKCSSVVKIDIISDVDNSQIQTDPQDLIELIWYQVGNSISGYYVN